MDAQKVDMFIISNGKYFDQLQIGAIRDMLLNMDESKWPLVASLSFNGPTMMLLVSIFAGGLGIDRFIIGDTGLGVGKLVTLGGCGIWAFVDWFLIQKATKEKNLQKLYSAISFIG